MLSVEILVVLNVADFVIAGFNLLDIWMLRGWCWWICECWGVEYADFDSRAESNRFE